MIWFGSQIISFSYLLAKMVSTKPGIAYIICTGITYLGHFFINLLKLQTYYIYYQNLYIY